MAVGAECGPVGAAALAALRIQARCLFAPSSPFVTLTPHTPQLPHVHTPIPQPMSQKVSSRILKEARAQQAEVDAEEDLLDEAGGSGGAGAAAALLSRGALSAALQRLADSDDEDQGEEGGGSDNDSVWAPGALPACPARAAGRGGCGCKC